MTGMTVGFALCGSFCTIDKAIIQMENLVKESAEVIPIMSEIVQTCSTRFGDAESRIKRIETITQKEVLKTIKRRHTVKEFYDAYAIAREVGFDKVTVGNGITLTASDGVIDAHAVIGDTIRAKTNFIVGSTTVYNGKINAYRLC